MEILESIRSGLKEFSSNKLRTILSILGVVFGVAAVIAMISIGEGARYESTKQIALMGINNIKIKPLKLKGEKLARARQLGVNGLTQKDLHNVKANCPSIVSITPLKILDEQVEHAGKKIEANLVGTDEHFPDVSNFRLLEGRFINHYDVEHFSTACVIGSKIKKDLFGSENPIGKEIRVGKIIFGVIGSMEDKDLPSSKTSAIEIRDLNKDVYIPISSALKRFVDDEEESPISEISVQVDAPDKIFNTGEIIKKVLSRYHRGIEDYELVIPIELLKQSQKTQRIFNIVMGCIAGISLVVGGIGIMNIMLASVTQRTREIGIRRSVGATRKEIMKQFLAESVLISFTGGIIGVILGIMTSLVITVYAEWVTIISWKSILLAFLVATATGVFFGIYPARKASLLDPIESLRYE